MRIIIRMLVGCLATVLLAVSPGRAADRIVVGVGSSSNQNARVAGEESARKAKEGLGGEEAKIVIVFSARRQLVPALIEGLGSVFDKSRIYGCEGYAPVTADGNFADQGHNINYGTAVLAIGGDVKVAVAAEPVLKAEDRKLGFLACGKTVGDRLKQAAAIDAKSRIIFTFGNQHVGDNQQFVEGLTSVMGTAVPVVGAAAGADDAAEIVKGEIVKGVNIAVLVSGNFNVGVGLSGGGPDLVKKTNESLSAALKMAGGTAVLNLIFDCGGRRGELVKQQRLVEEHDVVKNLSGKAAVFGFYGGGEIGAAEIGAKAKGVGFSVAAAVISVD